MKPSARSTPRQHGFRYAPPILRGLGEVDEATLERLQRGVPLEDGMAHFDAVMEAGGEGANRWYHIILREGRNREVRRLWESQGVRVSRLLRVRYGPIRLSRELRPGEWGELDEEQMAQLLQAVGMPVEPPLPVRKSRRGPPLQRAAEPRRRV